MSKFTPLMIIVLFVLGTVLVNTVEGGPCTLSEYSCDKNEDCCSNKCVEDDDEMICKGDDMERYSASLKN
ncbi:hypothetical protein KQX54_004899 [Cotesia glomerata]|uniref:Uncharacterized protein n=1 Tax=Cotesia glomerata TaxID=32391 RepID=A0AAV7IJL2_COTGL|nr:hypothetical protein KQX54_004899 [Cotesia glomerata]